MDGQNLSRGMEVEITSKYQALTQEVSWADEVIKSSLNTYFAAEENTEKPLLSPPDASGNDHPYYTIVEELQLSSEDRLLIGISLMPILRPQSLDLFKVKNKQLDSPFSEFGGIQDSLSNSFKPTLETACFVLTNSDISARIEFFKTYTSEHKLFTEDILDRELGHSNLLKTPLTISSNFLDFILNGERKLPQYSSQFPAQLCSTNLEWEDLIVSPRVRHALEETSDWIEHKDIIINDWGFSKTLNSGHKVLLSGPPGTGKTLAATLLGKKHNLPVFKIELSTIVSKYIGETEKNLKSLFDKAMSKNWVLFFDEADALFGKRTETKGSNDRFANQEVSYLLQRIELHEGVVILASNFKENIDKAFSRRFHSIVQFQLPNQAEREVLWDNYLFSKLEVEKEVNCSELAEKYELSGAEIVNIQRYCVLKAAKRGEKLVLKSDIMNAIKREYLKSNKTL